MRAAPSPGGTEPSGRRPAFDGTEGDPAADWCSAPPLPELVHGIEQFNRGEFFACHETLEALWLREPRQERTFYQGIIQVAVGYYHLQLANRRGAIYSLRGGLERLRPFGPACQLVQVARLVVDVESALEQVGQLGPQRKTELSEIRRPKISWQPASAASL